MLAKPAVEAVENGDIRFRAETVRKTCTSHGCVISGLVYLVSCGGVPYPGMVRQRRQRLRWPAAGAKCVRENNLGADVALRQDEDVLDTGSPPRCGLSPPSAGRKHRRPPSVPPTSVMVSGFDIIFFASCPHDHDDHRTSSR